MIEAMIKLGTNSKLTVADSIFQNTLSMSRGSIILADYQQVHVSISNTSFISNFAIDGGIFFVHYSSYVSIRRSIM